MLGAMRAMLPFFLLIATPAVGEPLPRVTTDSREYCAELAARVALQPRANDATVRRLAEEGTRLCDTGHSRAGIAKLRRAMQVARGRTQGG
jgi:hypothetical protein